MEKVFEIRTEPHVAVVGPHRFEFEPEAVGGEFLAAYTKLQDLQIRLTGKKGTSSKPGKAAEEINAETLAELESSMREFLIGFMLPESAAAFVSVRLPQRVLLQLIEWVAELYGGGSGNPDAGTGPSTG